MISNICKKLLEEIKDFPPIYNDRLASHLSMVLVALDKLKADESSLNNFYNIYSKKLKPENCKFFYKEYEKSYISAKKYFKNEIQTIGIEKTIKNAINKYQNSLGASAFHCLIRLSYAVESGLESEIINALAFWKQEYHAFKLPPSSRLSINEILEQIKPLKDELVLDNGIIIDKMLQIYNMDLAKNYSLQPKDISFEILASASLELFKQTNGFTILHCITGCHALRNLRKYLDNEELALRHLFNAIIYAFLTRKHQAPDKSLKTNENVGWPEIINLVKNSKNDHQIKLVYSLYQEFNYYNNSEYLKVAQLVSLADWNSSF